MTSPEFECDLANRPVEESRLVPTQLAAMAAGVSEATIRKWASRGRITRYGTAQRALYDIDELLRDD